MEQWKRELEWTSLIICLIFKKGDPIKVDNYWGIALLVIAYIILSIAILRRIESYETDIVREYQCGFTKGRYTNDHVLILK